MARLGSPRSHRRPPDNGRGAVSDLRIVAILGTTLVVVGVVAVAMKLRGRRTFTWLVRRQLDALLVTVVLYSVFPTHLVSARVNVARIEGGEYTPLLHMFRQSAQPESAAELRPLSWRQHDVASRRTLAALDQASAEIVSTLGSVDRTAARKVLLEISRMANDGSSLEELLAIPTAPTVEEWENEANGKGKGTRSRAY